MQNSALFCTKSGQSEKKIKTIFPLSVESKDLTLGIYLVHSPQSKVRGLYYRIYNKNYELMLDLVTHTCNRSVQEAEAKGLRVSGQLMAHGQFRPVSSKTCHKANEGRKTAQNIIERNKSCKPVE